MILKTTLKGTPGKDASWSEDPENVHVSINKSTFLIKIWTAEGAG